MTGGVAPAPPAMPLPLVLYDGTCGLCDGFVQWLLRRDRAGVLRFAPLDGPTAAVVRARHPEIAGVDSVVLVDAAGTHVRSEAALRTVAALGGGWRLVALARVVPRGLRDAAYDVVARTRHRWFGRRVACRVPSAAERERFIDA